MDELITAKDFSVFTLAWRTNREIYSIMGCVCVGGGTMTSCVAVSTIGKTLITITMLE